ncbi:uncharacterized protein EDB91DRAFT_1252118 [Suillus paluster]|uniref:uncharacterized protein n=1 Tax=Suillus paluster TaxID=48578 RepID=UPI001B86AA4C|nr:uncharacterized protein EDB91DRAFT_1252118 [Suillus paluster]KAG1731481.1 hypothetical protein EDB91DRAFT_1252118 [Suillus paluster]
MFQTVIPVITVFTKYDILVDTLEAVESKEYNEAAFELLKRDTLIKLCIQPLKAVAGSDFPHAFVSVKDGYESTVRQLIDLTIATVAPEAALVAQRVDAGLKIKASITVGKKRYLGYWRMSANSWRFTKWHCLSVIYKDIINIWNLNDPHGHLADDRCKNLILTDLDIVETDITLWQMMITHTVHLTCIMHIVFLLASTGFISRRVIKIAVKAYEVAGKGRVHSAFQSHVPLIHSGEDEVLEEIVRLIESHSIKAEEVQDMRTKIGSHMMGLQLDEEW